MIFDILEQKLVNAGLVVAGESLFRNYMPPECSMGLMLRAPLVGIKINPFIPSWYRCEIQLITRHSDPVDGNILALAAARVLKVESLEIYAPSVERGRAHITLFIADTLPIQFPQLEGNGYEWSQHFCAAFGFKD